MTRRPWLLFCLLFLTACSDNRIETDKTLSNGDKTYIQSLNLLNKEETIYKFYSEFKNKVAGNFFTDKRIAKYWIDERDTSKDIIDFAYYPDIKSIDTVCYAGFTYCPYMLVTKNSNSQFKVCVDGKREEVKLFFEEAISKWQQNQNIKRLSRQP